MNRFAALLQEQIRATHVLLFGSRARGEERPDSDYDFIIVSPQFAGVNPLQRSVGLRHLWREAGGDSPIDLFCLTPEEYEFAQDRISLLSAVLPHAIELLGSPEPAA